MSYDQIISGTLFKIVASTLLDCGIRGDYVSIQRLPGAGDRVKVSQLTSGDLNEATEFFGALHIPEQIAFLKAVAAYEDTVDGVGSVTLLEHLASLKSLGHDDPLRDAYAWILGNTNSYWYYAGGMKSLDGLHTLQHMKYEIAAANERIDAERQAKDRARIAVKASGNLYNAVRRGDVKAVVALIALGADVESRCSDGKSSIDLAREKGRMDIAQILEAQRSSVVAISEHPLEY